MPSTTRYYVGRRQEERCRSRNSGTTPTGSTPWSRRSRSKDRSKRKALVVDFQKVTTLSIFQPAPGRAPDRSPSPAKVQNHSRTTRTTWRRVGTTYGWRADHILAPLFALPPRHTGSRRRKASVEVLGRRRRQDQMVSIVAFPPVPSRPTLPEDGECRRGHSRQTRHRAALRLLRRRLVQAVPLMLGVVVIRLVRARARQLPRPDDGGKPGQRSGNGRAPAQDLWARRSGVAYSS